MLSWVLRRGEKVITVVLVRRESLRDVDDYRTLEWEFISAIFVRLRPDPNPVVASTLAPVLHSISKPCGPQLTSPDSVRILFRSPFSLQSHLWESLKQIWINIWHGEIIINQLKQFSPRMKWNAMWCDSLSRDETTSNDFPFFALLDKSKSFSFNSIEAKVFAFRWFFLFRQKLSLWLIERKLLKFVAFLLPLSWLYNCSEHESKS